jgi:hypothetical protein
MSKLYAVTLELAMNVAADSEEEAIRIATRNAREEDPDSYAVLSVQEGVAATGWPGSCIPYAERGKNTHGTVGAWLRHGKDERKEGNG